MIEYFIAFEMPLGAPTISGSTLELPCSVCVCLLAL